MQIIQVNLTSGAFQQIVAGAKLEFTYSVTWTPTSIPFARRFERYLDYNFFEHQVGALRHLSEKRSRIYTPSIIISCST